MPELERDTLQTNLNVQLILTLLQKDFEGMRQDVSIMKTAMFDQGGAGVGHSERIRKLESWQGVLTKIIWILMVALIGAWVTTLFKPPGLTAEQLRALNWRLSTLEDQLKGKGGDGPRQEPPEWGGRR